CRPQADLPPPLSRIPAAFRIAITAAAAAVPSPATTRPNSQTPDAKHAARAARAVALSSNRSQDGSISRTFDGPGSSPDVSRQLQPYVRPPQMHLPLRPVSVTHRTPLQL